MLSRRSILPLLIFSVLLTAGRHAAAQHPAPASPRLVVVLVLDQFPHHYLARFDKHFGPGGFRYLTGGGATFTNTTFKHANTSTGPGHAVLLSGTYARLNGITQNSWYDPVQGRNVYCVEDPSVRIIGASGEGRSPAHFEGFTYGDMLRIQNTFKSKSISLSNKDRAAILMGGRYADIALWMKDSLFVTSSYYTEHLPAWVERFNASGKSTSYFNAVWDRALPLAAYAEVDSDDVPYEEDPDGLGRAFPHPIRGKDTTQITPSYFSALLTSPFSADLLAALAKEAVKEERLGKRGVTDLLAVSFSSTDYVGHAFGPQSHEMLDMTVRMDRLLADFFRFLDREVGLAHCLFVMTSDHGVSPIPWYINTRSGRSLFRGFDRKSLTADAERILAASFRTADSLAWIDRIRGTEIYFRRATLQAAGVEAEAAARVLCDYLARRPEVATALTRGQLRMLSPRTPLEQRLLNSFNEHRGGDAVVVLQPTLTSGDGDAGATHGYPFESDAHVALVMRGPGVVPGIYHHDASPADIGPTLCVLTGVEFMPIRQGRVLVEALDTRVRGGGTPAGVSR